jgi:hypothetical protein
MKIRRICINVGPCGGKSALASWLYSELTFADYRIQLVTEYVKQWAYIGRVPKTWDQLYLFSKQVDKEYSFLNSGEVDLIVSDCPLLMVCAYAIKNGCPFVNELLDLSKKFDENYPAMHLFLDRSGIPYRTEGRFQTYEQAVELDNIIENTMKEHLPSYSKVRTRDRYEILGQILKEIKS